MSETPRGTETTDGGAGDGATAAPPTPRRGPHRGTDPREAIAELTVRAHEISQDAGNKMAGAMRDVINAAAGLAGFAVESARDLIQYMVRRGQMSPQEGEKLLRQAEEAAARHPRATTEPARADRRSAGNGAAPQTESHAAPKATAAKTTGQKAEAKEAAPKESVRAAKAPAKSVAQKSASKSTAKVSGAGAATKTTSKPASKSPARSAGGGATKAPAKTAASRSGARAASKSAPAKAAAKKAPAKKSAKKPAPAAGTKKKTLTVKTAARKGGKRK